MTIKPNCHFPNKYAKRLATLTVETWDGTGLRIFIEGEPFNIEASNPEFVYDNIGRVLKRYLERK